MAQEEVKYILPSEGGNANDGRQVDLVLTYDPADQAEDGSYVVTSAAGTYSVINDDGAITATDMIVGLAPTASLGGNDNEMFLFEDPSASPIFTSSGITFTISNPNDSNVTNSSDANYGQVNFYDTNFSGSPPTDTPQYGEYGNNTLAAVVSQESAYVCFASGTLIRTDAGDVAVEDLVVGQRIITASGDMRPVRWLGHRTIGCHDKRLRGDACPVRIAARAFGENRPARDLYISPGHPVLVGADVDGAGGHLVPIMCLINGTTIDRVAVNSVTYWHVELDAHDILLANGLPAESYFDLGSRPWFSGANMTFYNPDIALADMPGRCRPVALDGPIVAAERLRLDEVFAQRLAAACAWPNNQGTWSL